MLAVGKERDEQQISSATPRELIHDSLPKFDQLVSVVDLGRIRSSDPPTPVSAKAVRLPG
jgi:hypothetical protein